MKKIKIKSFHKDFSINEIIASILKTYLDKKRIINIPQSCECNKYINFFNKKLHSKINLDKIDLTLKSIESLFEILIDKERKKSEGAVYT